MGRFGVNDKKYLTDYFIEYNNGKHVVIHDSISDRLGQRVGIRLRGGGYVSILGSGSNTFTGDVFILDYSGMSLRKNGIAIQGNVYLKNGGNLTIDAGNQINKKSIVSLKNSSFIFFNVWRRNLPIEQSLSRLVVEGSSILNLSGNGIYFNAKFILDDLFINNDSLFVIRGWVEGWKSLLVRKDSEHLQDALSKIKFEGRSEPKASVRDYNNDYWEIIPGFPEPSTYGAFWGGLGLLLTLSRNGRCFWRRKLRLQKNEIGAKKAARNTK